MRYVYVLIKSLNTETENDIEFEVYSTWQLAIAEFNRLVELHGVQDGDDEDYIEDKEIVEGESAEYSLEGNHIEYSLEFLIEKRPLI